MGTVEFCCTSLAEFRGDEFPLQSFPQITSFGEGVTDGVGVIDGEADTCNCGDSDRLGPTMDNWNDRDGVLLLDTRLSDRVLVTVGVMVREAVKLVLEVLVGVTVELAVPVGVGDGV